ncbi:MAG TPA: methyltransferase domain-containing protein [Opitutaceae bacterium]|nr:methyltransferase domain-containing protein [Opitutaceae bacterium]
MANVIKDFLRPYWHQYRRWRDRRPIVSETSKCRARLAPFCVGDGVDLGFGGDPITPTAVRIDMPAQYGVVGSQLPAQLRGSADKLYWFRDASLDYIYSSHLLEDFVDTEAVLREWWRVLKPGGRLLIFCPDEQVYRAHCARTGQYRNEHHVHADFSLAKVRGHLDRIGPYRVLHEIPLVDLYSWDLVVEKL